MMRQLKNKILAGLALMSKFHIDFEIELPLDTSSLYKKPVQKQFPSQQNILDRERKQLYCTLCQKLQNSHNITL